MRLMRALGMEEDKPGKRRKGRGGGGVICASINEGFNAVRFRDSGYSRNVLNSTFSRHWKQRARALGLLAINHEITGEKGSY